MGTYDQRAAEAIKELSLHTVTAGNPAIGRLRERVITWFQLRDRLLDTLLEGLKSDAQTQDGIQTDWPLLVNVARTTLKDLIENGRPDARTEAKVDVWWNNLLLVEDEFLDSLGKLPVAKAMTDVNVHGKVMQALLAELDAKWKASTELCGAPAQRSIDTLSSSAAVQQDLVGRISAGARQTFDMVRSLATALGQRRSELDAELLKKLQDASYAPFLNQAVDYAFAHSIQDTTTGSQAQMKQHLSSMSATSRSVQAEMDRCLGAFQRCVNEQLAAITMFRRDRQRVAEFDRATRWTEVGGARLQAFTALSAWASGRKASGQAKDAESFAIGVNLCFQPAVAAVQSLHDSFSSRFAGKYEGSICDASREELARQAPGQAAIERLIDVLDTRVMEEVGEQLGDDLMVAIEDAFLPFISGMSSSLPEETRNCVASSSVQSQIALRKALEADLGPLRSQLRQLGDQLDPDLLRQKFSRSPLEAMLR
jgi:hypothetical protein